MEKFFMMSMRFNKISHIDFGLTATENPQVFLMKSDNSYWIKRLLYDFGWGQECGFELLPELPFNELIGLVENQWVTPKQTFFSRYTDKQIQEYDVYFSNLYGAVSVIMQDYVDEFIEFLTDMINTDYFVDKGVCDNFKCFSFSSSEMRKLGKIPGGILTKSYEEILNKYEKWRKI